MAQGTGRKAGGGLARPVTPSADLARSPEAHRFRAARWFRRCGITSARTTCKTRKTNGKSWPTTAQADLWGQGSGQHVRDEQASLEPPEVSFSASQTRRGSASAGPLFYVDKPRLGRGFTLSRDRRAFLGHREAEMRRDGDEFLAVALLHPGRHRLDRMSQRVGSDRLECRMLRQPFERAPGRKDQARFAASLAFQNLPRVSQAAAAHSPSTTCGRQSPAGSARRRTTCRSGEPHGTSAPSARTASARRVDLKAACAQASRRNG